MKPDVQSYVDKCTGLRVVESWRGEHFAIFLELGKLHKHSDQRKLASKGRGDVTIMLDCRWRLETKRSKAVGSLDTYRKIESTIMGLIGKPIRKISFIGRIPELVVEFDDD